MEHSVEVTNLTRTFGDFTAVNEISFSVKKGEIFGFLGPNGAGKSTTIKMLCGLLMPTSGQGHVAGLNIIDGQEEIKKIIGYMSQRFSLYEDLTVSENLEFFGSIYGLQGRLLNKRMNHVIDMVDLKVSKNSMVKMLPGGMKQRLALGAAVLHDPPILFLDEPTSGVDPLMRRIFWEQIYDFSSAGKTVFVTTHYMDEAEHCDRMALIIQGTIIALDSPARLKQSIPSEVFLVRTESFLDTFELLSSQTFVQEAALFGTDIHVLVEHGRGMKNRIISLLKKQKIGTVSVKKISPSLEDVFVVYARKYGL